jgi:subtilisin family serine protease
MLRKTGTALLLSMLVLILGFYGFASAGPTEINPDELETIQAPTGGLSKLPLQWDGFVEGPRHPKFDAALSGLVHIRKKSPGRMKRFGKAHRLRFAGNRVHVQVITDRDRIGHVVRAIRDAGGVVTGTGALNKTVQGWLPVDSLEDIAAEENIYAIRKPAEAVLFEGMYTTEALDDIDAPAWHTAGAKGAGVKVAIIDAGFSGYAGLLGTDLPGSVSVRNFVDGEDPDDVSGTTVHGTACAEVIHDVAPEAELYLFKISTNVDLEEAKDEAISQGIDVVSTSMGWYNLAPGDGTGQFEEIVQDARSTGITWCTAAGNDRQAHWGGAFNDTDSDTLHEYGTQEMNYYGPGDGAAYNINAGTTIRAFLRWDDWTSVTEDYGLGLVYWNANVKQWQWVLVSNAMQDGGEGQTPTEWLSVTAPDSGPYGFVIIRYSSSRNVNLELFCPKVARLDEIVTARSLANLADSPSAVTVAALDVDSPYPQESYSSEGPVNGPGGTATGALFDKPNISAYANVSTVSYGTTTKFNGTSAATPHVAGAAALVQGAYPGYEPADIQDYLEDNAEDMGDPGVDTVFGWGRLLLGDAPVATCTGDYDTDGDVDGADLYAMASDPAKLADLSDFSGNFGSLCQ